MIEDKIESMVGSMVDRLNDLPTSPSVDDAKMRKIAPFIRWMDKNRIPFGIVAGTDMDPKAVRVFPCFGTADFVRVQLCRIDGFFVESVSAGWHLIRRCDDIAESR
jgi:hypothetical protein